MYIKEVKAEDILDPGTEAVSGTGVETGTGEIEIPGNVPGETGRGADTVGAGAEIEVEMEIGIDGNAGTGLTPGTGTGAWVNTGMKAAGVIVIEHVRFHVHARAHVLLVHTDADPGRGVRTGGRATVLLQYAVAGAGPGPEALLPPPLRHHHHPPPLVIPLTAVPVVAGPGPAAYPAPRSGPGQLLGPGIGRRGSPAPRTGVGAGRRW